MPSRERRRCTIGGRRRSRGTSSSGFRFENGTSSEVAHPRLRGAFFRFPVEPRMSKPGRIKSIENRYLRYAHQSSFVKFWLIVSVSMAVMFGVLAAWIDHEGHFWFHLFVECTLFFGTI